MLLSKLFMYLLIYFTYLCAEWTMPPLVFSNIINILVSVNNGNFTSVFLNQARHANTDADKKWAGSSPYISLHFQIHLQATMYNFEHINHDIHLSFLF